MRIWYQEIFLISIVMMPTTTITTTSITIVIVSSGSSNHAVLYVYKRMNWAASL